MNLASWSAFVAATLVALVIPGPDFVIVAQATMRSIRSGALTSAGVVVGLLLHAGLAVVGVAALIAAFPSAMSVVQLLGATVLAWFGLSMLRSLRSRETTTPRMDGASAGGFVRGFLSNATNPKAFLFFGSILPQFIGTGENAQGRALVLCTTLLALSALWWTIVVASLRALERRVPSMQRSLTLWGGIVLMFLALWLGTAAVIAISNA